ncbi:MAG TPA: CopD family protein [Nitrosopumilaceae archaeon]|nr:CopD family protein [Nitrosopumilaceae archaeon]
MRKLLIISLLVLSISIPFAAAHPFTEETSPSSATNAPIGITEITVIFSEPIELDFSSLKVFDNNGNQIDNKDSKYYQGENSLIVSTPSLEGGVYTVTSKVLSKVDGHLVNDAFIFGVGNVKIDVPIETPKSIYEIIFFPEAAARFPGLVGQTIVLGSVIASMLIWGTQNKNLIRKDIEKINFFHHGKFMILTGIGLMAVFASNIAMLAVQTLRLETSAFDAIQTTFGTSWLIRMIITIILLGVWFWMDRKKHITKKNQIPMLLLSLALIGTTTMIGHGSASGEMAAVALDYVHNLVAAIWIGGIIYFVFTLLPTFSKLDNIAREKMSLVMIPRFSIAFIIAVGIVIITGPTLMWILESDIGIISQSIYGKLIIAKIVIASIMIGLGGFFQYKVQKSGEKAVNSKSFSVHRRLKRSLKIDVTLGIILLGVVALLTNGTLPAGEIQKVDAKEVLYGFRTIEFSESAKFDIEITPFSSGTNNILVKVSDFENNQLQDVNEVKVKISNPERNISPIEVLMEKTSQEENKPEKFQGELTFGFSGQWQTEVEIQRTQNANESVIMNLLVKPRLPDLQIEIIEYDFPEPTKPLYPLYDGENSIWISDPGAPRLWQFSLDSQEFTSHPFDGVVSVMLTKDNEGKIWFNDPPRNQIGFFDPNDGEITTITLPKIAPTIDPSRTTFLQSDFDGNIWIVINNKDKILKYSPDSNSFEEIQLAKRSLPFTLAVDNEGKIWFAETGTGMIGFINPENNEITKYSDDEPLEGPEALIFDKDGNLWIAEHTGTGITKFNPILETFEKIPVPDKEALPFGMAFDRYDNIWFAQHTVDNIAAYDPHNNNLIEVPVPTETSFIQFMTSDDNDNIWFVEFQGNKLGMVKITEIPLVTSQIQTTEKFELKYTELASPLIAMGIVATSLFFVKSVKDKRRLNALINS